LKKLDENANEITGKKQALKGLTFRLISLLENIPDY